MNPWHNSRLLDLAANLLFASALMALLAAFAGWVAAQPMFALRQVQIEPVPGHELRHAPDALLRHAARKTAGGSFFTINLTEVRASFERVPWVRHASVRRIWPNRLVVEIEEHRPVALWGDERLLNRFGEVFTANVVEAEEDGPLPQLVGPDGSEGSVMRRFAELKSWLAEAGRTPTSLELSDRHAWTVTLDDGTTLLLGRDQGVPIEERVRRWAAVITRVQARLDRNPQIVDLRYPNGFAVRSVGLAVPEGATGARKGSLSVAGLNTR